MEETFVQVRRKHNEMRIRTVIALTVWVWIMTSNIPCFFYHTYLITLPICLSFVWTLILYIECKEYLHYRRLLKLEQIPLSRLNPYRGKRFIILYSIYALLFITVIVIEIILISTINLNEDTQDVKVSLARCFLIHFKYKILNYFIVISILNFYR